MTDGDDAATCAVWYQRYGGTYYELCTDEEQAASYAFWTEERGDGSVHGIQFADGRIIARDCWKALADMEAEIERVAPRDPLTPTPVRDAIDPFTKERAVVFADDPDWLGAATPTAEGTP